MRVIVAGGRNITDYQLVKTKLDWLFRGRTDITIVSGGAKGADSLGERYAKENQLSLIICNANWDRYGKSAGFIRNKEMAEISDGLILIWDGLSKGSKHMKDLAEKQGLKIREIIVKI